MGATEVVARPFTLWDLKESLRAGGSTRIAFWVGGEAYGITGRKIEVDATEGNLGLGLILISRIVWEGPGKKR